MMAKRTLLVAMAFGGLVLASSLPANAGLIDRIVGAATAKQPAKAKAQPTTGAGTPDVRTAASDDCAAAVAQVCCPNVCVVYRHKGPRLCCGDCRPPVETILRVKNPCTCCEVDVCVCLPACCTGEPTICNGSGFLGRPVVEYEWCCGYSVRVAFKHCGDVLVTTWGY